MNVSYLQEYNNDTITDNLDDNSNKSAQVQEESNKYDQVIYYFALFLLVPLILAGNSLILWAIARFKSLNKVTYYLLGNLAVADILSAVGIALRSIIHLIPVLATDWIIRCQIFLFNVSLLGSLSGTFIISLHTFLAVKSPVLFRDGFTVKLAAQLVTFEWLLVIILFFINALKCEIQFENDGSFVGVKFQPGLSILTGSLVIIHVLLLVSLQVSTVIKVEKSRSSLQNQPPQGNPVTAAVQARLDTLSRTVVIVSIITVLILIAWLPALILFPIAKMCSNCGIKESDVATIASVCFLPNMIGNFVIYFIKSKEFNDVLCTICKCFHVNPQAAHV